MSVYKRGKYWIVQFNHNNRTYTRSSKSTRKRDALELERQMRQQIVDTQVLGHRERIKLYDACDDLPKHEQRIRRVWIPGYCHEPIQRLLRQYSP